MGRSDLPAVGARYRFAICAIALGALTVSIGSAASSAPEPIGPSPSPAVAALIRDIQAEMLDIPAGSFRMGSVTATAGDDERVVRTVTVRRFRLAKYDLTSAQYAIFAHATGRAPITDPDTYPAVNISWNDAQAFIAWLDSESGLKFRLPSEAEWEYAARAGSSTDYWWGNTYSADHANGTGVKGRDIWPQLAPVGQFPPNRFGLYDVLGNIWQWTADCYAPSYRGAPTNGSPVTGPAGCGRVLRGGSWCDTPEWMRVSTRNWFEADDRFDYIGARLAEDAILPRGRRIGSPLSSGGSGF